MIPPKNILIVEDEPSLAHILTRTIKREWKDMDVETCSTADAARIILSQRPYALVISDYRLPGETGLHLLAHIRKTFPETRTVLITAYATDSVRSEAERVADGFLAKPFSIADLRKLVMHQLDLPSDTDAVRIMTDVVSKRILLMDDDPDLVRLYAKALTSAGHEVEVVNSMTDAQQKLVKTNYDVFICDIHIGDDVGLDLLPTWRAEFLRDKTRVIVISGDTRYRDMAEAMGANRFITKPVAIKTLLASVL
jgi:DNA-binding NtrC family response regulator